MRASFLHQIGDMTQLNARRFQHVVSSMSLVWLLRDIVDGQASMSIKSATLFESPVASIARLGSHLERKCSLSA